VSETVTQSPEQQRQGRTKQAVRRFLRTLGPGFITGASDDDPSGIATYSQAGAQLGFGIGWTMLLTYPLMSAIQEICARIGRTTGHGIAGNLCRHYPAWLLYPIVALLFTANTINIGANLSAMADALKLLVGGPGTLYVITFGTACALASVFIEYDRYVAVLKWMTLSLFAYVAAVFAIDMPWSEAASGVLIPTIYWNSAFFTTVVAILGTTISPYLFFWQASQEVEDDRVDDNRDPLVHAPRQAPAALRRIRADTLIGMAFSNNCWRLCFFPVRDGNCWHRASSGSGASWRSGLRDRRGSQMACWPVQKAEACQGILLDTGPGVYPRHGHSLHPCQPDTSALLERGDKRCCRRTGDVRDDADDCKKECHGRIHDHRLAALARVGGYGRNRRICARDDRHLVRVGGHPYDHDVCPERGETRTVPFFVSSRDKRGLRWI